MFSEYSLIIKYLFSFIVTYQFQFFAYGLVCGLDVIGFGTRKILIVSDLDVKT